MGDRFTDELLKLGYLSIRVQGGKLIKFLQGYRNGFFFFWLNSGGNFLKIIHNKYNYEIGKKQFNIADFFIGQGIDYGYANNHK